MNFRVFFYDRMGQHWSQTSTVVFTRTAQHRERGYLSFEWLTDFTLTARQKDLDQ